MPQPRGACAHLCRFAEYQSTPSDAMSSRRDPGTCAPSTRTGTPRAPALRGNLLHREEQRRLGGDMVDDDEFRARRQRTDDRIDDVAAIRMGYSTWTVRSVAPVAHTRRRPRARPRRTPRSVMTISSPAAIGTDPSTALRPVVTFGHEHEIVGPRADEGRDLIARFAQSRNVRHGIG